MNTLVYNTCTNFQCNVPNVIQLNAGETFGEMKEQRGPAKLSYPIYTTKEPSALMRITAFNYQKVIEVCSMNFERNDQLVKHA